MVHTRRKAFPFRPLLERLEERAMLAVFTVTNTDDGGSGSLRQAILSANAAPNVSGPDEIHFDIAGAGVHTIRPAAPLPVIADPVIIDGYTQPGAAPNTLASGNNAVLRIELSGESLSTQAHGLAILGGNSTVRGLVINRFPVDGIRLGKGGNGNLIEGNFIGTNAAGTAALGNGDNGVEIRGSSDNTIGGVTPQARNLLSGNGDTGARALVSDVATTNNVVQGNYIGVNAAGTGALPNGFRTSADPEAGVALEQTSGNTVGGTASGAGNLIAGNTGSGVLITGSANLVQGNRIGLDVSGVCLGNKDGGVAVRFAGDNTIGGTASAARNVISCNGGNVLLGNFFEGDAGATGNLVQGNFIGTNVSGTGDPTSGPGVSATGIAVGSRHNTIGGSTPGARNLVSGNITGIFLDSGDNVVQGNLVGTDVSGTHALGNDDNGILIDFNAPRNTIGGTSAGARNIISGNERGVFIADSRVFESVLQGNFIGTDLTGNFAIGNQREGILIANGSARNTVGGSNAAAGNQIAFNKGVGIRVESGATRNSILRNSIFQNAMLGIDLGSLGVTSNDPMDDDAGANELQNFPTLSSAISKERRVAVRGVLNSTPNTNFRVEFFVSPRCDASGNGEGQNLLGVREVTTDGAGNASFKAIFSADLSAPRVVTATATDELGNTSEFSGCSPLITAPFIVAGADAGGGPAVRIFTPGGFELVRFHAYDPSFSGGVRVATGDVDGDGFPEIITAPGSGMPPIVRIFTGTTLLRIFSAYGSFAGGVFVAAGDVDGDGSDEIITGADAGGGPAVRVFSGAGSELLRFHAFAPTFSGGVRVAAGDTNGDGAAEIIASPGRGGSPQVRIFNGTTGQLLRTFLAYDSTFTGGVYVAAGDVRDDGRIEIITGAGAGGGPAVRIFDTTGIEKARFHAYESSFNGGVRVGIADADGDGKGDIITGPSPGGTPLVKAFDGADLTLIDHFFAYNETFDGGVFVAGG